METLFNGTLSLAGRDQETTGLSNHQTDSVHHYEGCEVLTLGNDKLCIPLPFPKLFHDLNVEEEKISSEVSGGTVHYIRVNKGGSNVCKEIVSLDLQSETFTTAALPQVLFSNWSKIWPLNWNGFLDLLIWYKEILISWDYKRLKWDNREIVLPFSALVKMKPEFFGDLLLVSAEYVSLATLRGIEHHQRASRV
ncbi:conserved hypothetical protein [Ricinus communis]|uniref:Uncharacterized protein n=1 Tax=Ricinus communis TaxID=3988 RepID=B9RXV3_RICCO|nr:conserved hypothetical protein [Ricinus communis]